MCFKTTMPRDDVQAVLTGLVLWDCARLVVEDVFDMRQHIQVQLEAWFALGFLRGTWLSNNSQVVVVTNIRV